MEYNRITYPERAEYLNEGIFSDYKIFLDHWKPIGEKLKSNHEESILRKVSKTLLIYGEQSTGKTLLANKINRDYNQSKSEINKTGSVEYNKDNIWHLITSGYGKNVNNIKANTQITTIFHIEDNKNWVQEAKDFCNANKDRTCVLIADNCERDYFIQDLVGLSDTDYLAVGRSDALISRAAVNYVALCRTELRGAFVILLTNDDSFALNFEDSVNKQHTGLVEIESLPFPGNNEKETVIRVNTNRLNPFTYWFCLDRAGVQEKKNAFRTIQDSKNYKDCYHAIDNALKKVDSSRMGRPPKKCLLTLFVLIDSDKITNHKHIFNESDYIENYYNESLQIITFSSNWGKFGISNERQRKLLESEWNLRIVITSNNFNCQLLYGNQENVKNIIDSTLVHHGPGTHEKTKIEHYEKLDGYLESCINDRSADIHDFWSKGQVRSHIYEKSLQEIYSTYNTTGTGFLKYRPDLILKDYTPCSLLNSENDQDDKINAAIRRNSIVCEFTAIKDFNFENVCNYLEKKLSNYVEILEDQ